MGTSDYRKRSYAKSGSTINVKVLGATANLPYGLQAYGKDCVGDKANASKTGYFAYLAAPLRGRALMIHEHDLEGGTVFHVWDNTASKDAPPGRVTIDKKPAMTPAKVENKIAALTRVIEKEDRKGIRSHTILKGRWSAYIECPTGRIILTRDIANFTTLALVSDPAKAVWQYAIHIKDLKTTHWFTSPSAKAKSPGVKSVSITGSKGNMVGAFNAAMKELMRIVGEASSIKETVRRASVDAAYRRGRTKGTAKRAGQKSSPLTKGEKRSYRSAKIGLKRGAGRIGRTAESLQRKPGGANGRLTRIRTTPLKGQTSLKGKYITFGSGANVDKSLKGKIAYVAKIGPNGRGNYDSKDGGAKLYLWAISPGGDKVASRLKGGVLELRKDKRTFTVKGKSAFNAALRKRAAVGKTDKKPYPRAKWALDALKSIKEVTGNGPPLEETLGKRIYKAAVNAPPSKSSNGRRKSRKKPNGKGRAAETALEVTEVEEVTRIPAGASGGAMAFI